MDNATLSFIDLEYAHLKSVYFNSAYFGPSPISAKKDIEMAMEKELDPSFYEYHDWMSISEGLRVKLSQLLNTSPDNITHSTSSSDVVNILANGYPFKNGDRVATIDKDYPSNVLPWMLAEKTRGIVLDRFELGNEIIPTADWIAKKIQPQTKIFNMSWVTFDTGKKMDLISIGKMLREKEIMFVVDATQGLGGLAISEEELSYIDVLTCSSYKWILGPYGHAFAYFSPKAQKSIQHLNGNWILSPKSKEVYNLLDYSIETLPGARMYDRGQAANLLGSACLNGAVDFLLKIGLKKIEEHNKKLTYYFLENFPKNKYQLVTPIEHMANIVCLKAKNLDSIRLEKELKARNVDVSVRQGNVRISFHIFNTILQTDKLITALDS